MVIRERTQCMPHTCCRDRAVQKTEESPQISCSERYREADAFMTPFVDFCLEPVRESWISHVVLFLQSSSSVRLRQGGVSLPIFIKLLTPASQLEFCESISTCFLLSRLPHLVVYRVSAVAAATCGRRCGVFVARCRGSGRTIPCDL